MNKKDWDNPELNVLGVKDTANTEDLPPIPCDYCTTRHYTEEQKALHNSIYHKDRMPTS